MENNLPTMDLSADVLKETAARYRHIASRNLHMLFGFQDNMESEGITNAIQAIVHSAVLEVAALIQQANVITKN